MSLYRTWRPKTFDDLVGQDAVVRTLTGAIESGKLAHAYLFSGPRGSGKTSAAKILARCIDCVSGPTATPDNTCANCVAILNGSSLDVLEIDAASYRGIDQIRDLRDAVKFAPSSMRMKVYIIDEAHMLTKEGANAFLKTLEEPPPHAVFILATTEPEKLPVTILSRCQRYAFRRIEIPVMIERMREIAAAENIGIDEDALAAIAYRADGGLRDALTMLEQASAFAESAPITAGTLDVAFGTTGRTFANALVDAIVSRDAAGVLSTIESASDAGTDMQVLIRSLIVAFRNLLVARIDPALLARDLAPEDGRRAAERAEDVSAATMVRVLRLLVDAQTLARGGGHARLELESALLRFALTQEEPSLEALAARVANLEASGASQIAQTVPVTAIPAQSLREPAKRPAAEAEAEPSAPEPEAADSQTPMTAKAASGKHALTLQKVRAAWQSIRGKVEGERASLAASLSRATVDALEDRAVVLRFPDKLNADMLRDHVALVERAAADVLGENLSVVLRVETAATPGETPSHSPRRAKGGPGAAAFAAAPVRTAPPQDAGEEADNPDALFSYLNERISDQ
ncbi:MAG: DNA polymerase III subunit gamma/tau [Vulcanimicrobiaceae bacterium]